MALKIYNTLTRKQEPFQSIEPGKVGMYVCGVTVYDDCHIGHGRTFIAFDVIRRWLQASGYDVKFIRNVTDIDDKIIKRAAERGVLPEELAKKYTERMQEDFRNLGCLGPTVEPRATQYIPKMLALIETLEEKGYAYQDKNGDVDYSVRKFAPYGRLSGKKVDELQPGERVQVDAAKKDPLDFALWKSAKPGEPMWDSKWGKGRPGWHIECSGISMKYNGEYLDLHCGGVDNAFPHHTNEIAQSESFLGHPWCPHWFHVHHLNTNDGKMSKSKGEFLTVSLLEEKGCDPLAYRWFCLQSHYRKALVFSWENLDNAAAAYTKLLNRIAALNPEGETDQAVFDEYRAKFVQQVGNDLNTSMAVTAVFDALTAKTNDATRLAIIGEFDKVLSLSLLEKAAAIREKSAQATQTGSGEYTITGEGDPAVDALVLQRYEAKKAKNFAEADRIRDELKAQGVEVTDVKGGAVWKKI